MESCFGVVNLNDFVEVETEISKEKDEPEIEILEGIEIPEISEKKTVTVTVMRNDEVRCPHCLYDALGVLVKKCKFCGWEEIE